MSAYPPPIEDLPFFNPAVFTVLDIPLTVAEGEKYFLKYPQAQGTQSFTDINVGGIATIEDVKADSLEVANNTTLSGALEVSGNITGTTITGINGRLDDLEDEILQGVVHIEGTETITGDKTLSGTTTFTGNIVADGITLTPTELSYVDGATSNIQTQLNTKASITYVDNEITDAINALIDGAPTTLDTLNELAEALGDDPNFATTIATQIGLKANDADVVHKTGNIAETITGAKTFTSDNFLVENLAGDDKINVDGTTTTLTNDYNNISATISNNIGNAGDITDFVNNIVTNGTNSRNLITAIGTGSNNVLTADSYNQLKIGSAEKLKTSATTTTLTNDYNNVSATISNNIGNAGDITGFVNNIVTNGTNSRNIITAIGTGSNNVLTADSYNQLKIGSAEKLKTSATTTTLTNDTINIDGITSVKKNLYVGDADDIQTAQETPLTLRYKMDDGALRYLYFKTPTDATSIDAPFSIETNNSLDFKIDANDVLRLKANQDVEIKDKAFFTSNTTTLNNTTTKIQSGGTDKIVTDGITTTLTNATNTLTATTKNLIENNTATGIANEIISSSGRNVMTASANSNGHNYIYTNGSSGQNRLYATGSGGNNQIYASGVNVMNSGTSNALQINSVEKLETTTDTTTLNNITTEIHSHKATNLKTGLYVDKIAVKGATNETLLSNRLTTINSSYWVAVGQATNYIATSNDGITWTGRTSPFTTSGNGVAWNGSLWVAVGNGTSKIATSPDGITWTGRTSPFSTSGLGIAWNGSLWVAVGYGGATIATSTDGITWTGRTSPFTTYGLGIAWNGSLWVAVGFGGFAIATSPDGINWTGRTNPVLTTGYAVAWNGSLWVAVGDGTSKIATSPDGITWTGRTSPFSTNGLGIAWNGSLWVAVGYGGATIATSPDGITWTGRTSPFTTYGFGVAWNGSLWVAVGQGTYKIATSPDGITWTGRTSPFNYAGGGVAYGGNTQNVSIDNALTTLTNTTTSIKSGANEKLLIGNATTTLTNDYNNIYANDGGANTMYVSGGGYNSMNANGAGAYNWLVATDENRIQTGGSVKASFKDTETVLTNTTTKIYAGGNLREEIGLNTTTIQNDTIELRPYVELDVRVNGVELSDTKLNIIQGTTTLSSNDVVINKSGDCNLTIHSTSGNIPSLYFIRNSATYGADSQVDYRLYDTGGDFKIDSAYTGGIIRNWITLPSAIGTTKRMKLGDGSIAYDGLDLFCGTGTAKLKLEGTTTTLTNDYNVITGDLIVNKVAIIYGSSGNTNIRKQITSKSYVSANSGAKYFKVATLPVSSGGTKDFLELNVNGGDWTTDLIQINCIFRNRSGFRYSYETSGISNSITVLCLNNGGVVDVYIYMGTGFNTFKYDIDGFDCVVYDEPVVSTTITGTIIFDSYSATYPPNMIKKCGDVNFAGKIVTNGGTTTLTNTNNELQVTTGYNLIKATGTGYNSINSTLGYNSITSGRTNNTANDIYAGGSGGRNLIRCLADGYNDIQVANISKIKVENATTTLTNTTVNIASDDIRVNNVPMCNITLTGTNSTTGARNSLISWSGTIGATDRTESWTFPFSVKPYGGTISWDGDASITSVLYAHIGLYRYGSSTLIASATVNIGGAPPNNSSKFVFSYTSEISSIYAFGGNVAYTNTSTFTSTGTITVNNEVSFGFYFSQT